MDKYSIDAEDFYRKLRSEEYKEKAYYDFSLCKQLQVTGFPAVLIQTTDSKFYLAARGYTDAETLRNRIDAILKEIEKTSTPS